jgi:hypothetical protein
VTEQQQYPTREQIALNAEHLRVDVASLLLNRQYNGVLAADADAFYEGHTTDEQNDALATADAVLALLPQPPPSAEPKPLNPDAMQRALEYHGWPPA